MKTKTVLKHLTKVARPNIGSCNTPCQLPPLHAMSFYINRAGALVLIWPGFPKKKGQGMCLNVISVFENAILGNMIKR